MADESIWSLEALGAYRVLLLVGTAATLVNVLIVAFVMREQSDIPESEWVRLID
jgi:hypothetical protein